MVRMCEIYSSLGKNILVISLNKFSDLPIYKYCRTDSIAIPRHEMAKKIRFTEQEKGKLVKKLEESVNHSSTKTESNNEEISKQEESAASELRKEIESLKTERERLNNDLINSKKMLNEKNELSKQQEDTASGLRTEIESLKTKHQNLNNDLDVSKALLKEKDQEIRNLINEKGKYKTKCNEALSETKLLHEKIAKWDKPWHSLDSSQFFLNRTERKVYDRLLEYIDAKSNMPQSLKSRVKALKKMVASIRSYLSNSEDLVAKCKHS